MHESDVLLPEPYYDAVPRLFAFNYPLIMDLWLVECSGACSMGWKKGQGPRSCLAQIS